MLCLGALAAYRQHYQVPPRGAAEYHARVRQAAELMPMRSGSWVARDVPVTAGVVALLANGLPNKLGLILAALLGVAAGVILRVHDPEAMANVRKILGNKVTYCDRPYGALEGADGLAIITEWQEFRNPDFEAMRRLMRQPVIFDGRNLYDPHTVAGRRISDRKRVARLDPRIV